MFERRRNRIMILAVIAALPLAACAPAPTPTQEPMHNDAADHHAEMDDHHNAMAQSAEVIEGAEEIVIVATEFGFSPSVIELQESVPVNIVLTNSGGLEHELEIKELGFHLHTLPGGTAKGGLVPSESGEVEFACFVSGHYEAGMKGVLRVEH